MMNLVKRFRKEEKGATAIEYGLLAALIGVAVVVGAQALGTNVNEQFIETAERICLAEDGATFDRDTGECTRP